ncbi:MAG: ABC transporter ATP-binding protein [Deltaproteobacteria bacterium]|nr:ABC transporter ATP-binding protein [Deltaproteobacteria bacterium]
MLRAAPGIVMEGVHKHYALDGVEVHALRGVDLAVAPGEFLAISGASGSGKSTLMNIIGCLDVPDAGRFSLGGSDVTRLDADALAALRNRELGFVFQGFNLLPRTSALENVETPLIYSGASVRQRRERAREMLERLGLADRMAHLPSQLSGGQQQRVAIARALVNRPGLLLADEPTGNLDTATSGEILDLLAALNREEGLTIVLITHELEVAARAGRRLVMRDGLLEH